MFIYIKIFLTQHGGCRCPGAFQAPGHLHPHVDSYNPSHYPLPVMLFPHTSTQWKPTHTVFMSAHHHLYKLSHWHSRGNSSPWTSKPGKPTCVQRNRHSGGNVHVCSEIYTAGKQYMCTVQQTQYRDLHLCSEIEAAGNSLQWNIHSREMCMYAVKCTQHGNLHVCTPWLSVWHNLGNVFLRIKPSFPFANVYSPQVCKEHVTFIWKCSFILGKQRVCNFSS